MGNFERVHSGMTEAALSDRDDRIKQTLLARLAEHEDDAREAKERLESARNRIDLIRSAVQEERWYDLRGVLSWDDIESLCNVSPVGLLSEE